MSSIKLTDNMTSYIKYNRHVENIFNLDSLFGEEVHTCLLTHNFHHTTSFTKLKNYSFSGCSLYSMNIGKSDGLPFGLTVHSKTLKITSFSANLILTKKTFCSDWFLNKTPKLKLQHIWEGFHFSTIDDDLLLISSPKLANFALSLGNM